MENYYCFYEVFVKIPTVGYEILLGVCCALHSLLHVAIVNIVLLQDLAMQLSVLSMVLQYSPPAGHTHTH